MSYRVRIYGFEDASESERSAAVRRFSNALNAALGSPALVGPVYGAYQRLLAIHGESPDADVLSAEELEIFTQWQSAHAAALAAALGPHRYMGDAEFEITT